MLKHMIAVFLVLWTAHAWAEAKSPGTYYVVVDVLEERLGPSATAKVTNRDYRGQVTEVYEVKNGWARVSQYYDGEVEGVKGTVARWMRATGLSGSAPPKVLPAPPPSDPRIAADAFPSVGENGLTATDVKYLNDGALKFIESGKCSKVEYGDKSVSKPNTYYVTCEGQNIFFTPGDLQ